MKRHNYLYPIITDIDVIMQMYDRVIRVNTKNKRKLERFENYYSENIVSIKEELITNSYTPGNYNIFLVKEPKYRIVMSQEIRDKIVNHLVAKYFLLYCFDKTLIEENIATRINKGTHYGLRLFKKYMNIMQKNHKRFYVLKFDINKYFYNIDHEKTMELIERKIKDKKACEIIRRVINSTNEDYINKTIVKIKMDEIKRLERLNICNLEEKIEEISKLPLYKKGKGLPIGNMTSQIIATFYLNELDHFIKEKLGIKYYIRYMDDGVLIHEDKKYLEYCLKEIEKIINDYKLTLNKKTRIFSNKDNIEFLGFSFVFNDRIIMKVKSATKRRIKRRITEKNMSSYIGHLSHGDCHSLTRLILQKYV